MLVIRLSRTGSKNKAKYRLAVADSRKALTGRFIEIIGHFDPSLKDKKVTIDKNKYQEWVKKGAQPSQRVRSLFKKLEEK